MADIPSSRRSAYGNVVFGGAWVDQAIERDKIGEAIRQVAAAVDRCVDEDTRTDQLRAALDFLGARGDRTHHLAKDFWRALSIQDSESREMEATALLKALRERFAL